MKPRRMPLVTPFRTAGLAAGAAVLAYASLTWIPGLNPLRDSAAEPDGRAQVVAAASRHLTVLTTADPADAPATWRRWLDSSTGTLHDQFARDQRTGTAKLAAGRLKATGTVTAIGVTGYSGPGADATVIASVLVRMTSGAPEEARRYQATVRRTPQGWKLASLTAFSPPTPGTGAP
ncbi:hypothetical protein [Actinomadura sp. 9N407]|uniref:hypothetical protein n=1 Tax=Actinomadura sp. 9N407 TaxID=3375154 RepID=UPI003793A0E4